MVDLSAVVMIYLLVLQIVICPMSELLSNTTHRNPATHHSAGGVQAYPMSLGDTLDEIRQACRKTLFSVHLYTYRSKTASVIPTT